MDITQEQIEAIRQWAAVNPRVLQVRLFGSRFKGTSRPDSDIDLAVTISEDKHYTIATIFVFDLDAWRAELSKLVRAKADIRLTDLVEPCGIRKICEAGSALLYSRSGAD
jgi:predicted nucleotidyltransferase